jgi:prevent-host-death family protein
VRTLKASEFEARCLALMDQVARTGEPILITRNGQPVAELAPVRPKPGRSPIGMHKGRIRILGDIVVPIDAGWNR